MFDLGSKSDYRSAHSVLEAMGLTRFVNHDPKSGQDIYLPSTTFTGTTFDSFDVFYERVKTALVGAKGVTLRALAVAFVQEPLYAYDAPEVD